MRVDLLVIGGGVNGCAIARDAAGRGLSVALVEQGDLAQATSSASTKLFHGGLRYLEHYEFRLVRESLAEREILLRAMPHISWPLRFVLPHHAGLRPAWMLRLGLFLYDHLGGRRILPPTRTLDLRADVAGGPLRPEFVRAFEYSDCWVDDARLVVLLARDASARGATIRTRTRLVAARREGDLWRAEIDGAGGPETLAAGAVVNAAGPWVEGVAREGLGLRPRRAVRLVRGSHIVVRRLFEHDRAYIFQQLDGRIVFAIPYEGDFTLVGTTDIEHEGSPGAAACSAAERDYLLASASAYFATPVTEAGVVWSYSGVRPLFDDGTASASAATRDYVLELDGGGTQAPALSVFGGKITTHRRLAEAAMARLRPHFPGLGPDWTAGVALPGGDFPWDGAPALAAALRAAHPFLDAAQAARLVRLYGTEATVLLGGARSAADLGEDFGGGLSARELGWLRDREWALTAEDVLWRRTKLGLRLDAGQAARVAAFLAGEKDRRVGAAV